MSRYQPMIYLATIDNHHPEVMMRYKYIILADNLTDAISKAKSDFDGKFNSYCKLESITAVQSLCDYAWYLSDYIPELL